MDGEGRGNGRQHHFPYGMGIRTFDCRYRCSRCGLFYGRRDCTPLFYDYGDEGVYCCGWCFCRMMEWRQGRAEAHQRFRDESRINWYKFDMKNEMLILRGPRSGVASVISRAAIVSSIRSASEACMQFGIREQIRTCYDAWVQFVDTATRAVEDTGTLPDAAHVSMEDLKRDFVNSVMENMHVFYACKHYACRWVSQSGWIRNMAKNQYACFNCGNRHKPFAPLGRVLPSGSRLLARSLPDCEVVLLRHDRTPYSLDSALTSVQRTLEGLSPNLRYLFIARTLFHREPLHGVGTNV